MFNGSSAGREAGVALLTALVVVAVATTVASHLVVTQQLDIRRTGNLVMSDQALVYAMGAESFAKVALRHDAKISDIDAPNDIWAQDNPPLPVPGGYVSGKIEDLQGRFNLNSLLSQSEPQAGTNERQWVQDTAAVGRYEALLRHLEIDPAHVLALTDWIDPDQQAQTGGGAEDGYYMRLERPYRSAGRLLVSPSELRLLRGVTAAEYNALRPHVAALPERTPINVNMATEAVLVAIGLTAEQAQNVVEKRVDAPFESIEAFRAYLNLTPADLADVDLAVTSHYFLVTAQVELQRGRLTTYSVLFRNNNGELHVLRRTLGSL